MDLSQYSLFSITVVRGCAVKSEAPVISEYALKILSRTHPQKASCKWKGQPG